MNPADNPVTAEDLILALQRLRDTKCTGCGGPVSAHDTLMSMVMGFKNQPRCLPCLAAGLEEEPAKLREAILGYIHRRPCYAEAWQWAARPADA